MEEKTFRKLAEMRGRIRHASEMVALIQYNLQDTVDNKSVEKIFNSICEGIDTELTKVSIYLGEQIDAEVERRIAEKENGHDNM